ncbi:MAG: hypothetical protein BWY63_03284 [Chloroflexi bacterium ADurb.Bin360]|nr:MAG: hypothetical protein BWY63_03284 [Chloroflexi bacterium ADurb.Bin360]
MRRLDFLDHGFEFRPLGFVDLIQQIQSPEIAFPLLIIIDGDFGLVAVALVEHPVKGNPAFSCRQVLSLQAFEACPVFHIGREDNHIEVVDAV